MPVISLCRTTNLNKNVHLFKKKGYVCQSHIFYMNKQYNTNLAYYFGCLYSFHDIHF